MQRTRVAVLRGGPSEEYDVSLKTGLCMLEALDQDRYEPIDVVISKSGEWLHQGRVKAPHEIFHQVDLVLVGLHGAFGEDGKVQRLMDAHGVKYTGSGAFASAVALNKVMTKDRLRELGVNMARHMHVHKDAAGNIEGVASAIRESFGPRYIVKPIASGSSIGALFANNALELERALRKSFETYDGVLVEEFIEGKEATCGVVENFRGRARSALPPIEIRRSTPVWGYEAKYDGSVEEICPGNFSRAEKDEIERVSLLAHETLGLSHYSRSDFIVTSDLPGRQAGGIYFLEVNTLPGMTPTSLLPKALEAVGMTYPEFIEHLLQLAGTRR